MQHLFKAFFNKDKNNFYYNILLEKRFYKLPKKQVFAQNINYILWFDLSEANDVNKTSETKECNICHFWYFLNKDFKYQQNVCNGAHNLLIMSLNLSNIDIYILKVLIIVVLSMELPKVRPYIVCKFWLKRKITVVEYNYWISILNSINQHNKF